MSLTRAQVLDFHAAMESHQRSLGVFEAVNMHEPKSAPQLRGVTASTWIQTLGPARGASGLAATTIRLEYRTRIYSSAMRENADMIEPEVIEAAAALMEAYSGDFELGGRVREVDLLGHFGPGLGWQAGYLNLEGKFYRVLDLTVPLIVNDVWPQDA